jgi:hypothetical protein
MNTHSMLYAILVACALSSTATAQQPGQPAGSGNASPSRPADDSSRATMTNVQVELTVTDSMGSAAPVKKTVSMITVDGRMGRIRSAREHTPAVLNVDATPTIMNNQIRLQLTLEYSPPLVGDSPTRLAHVSQAATLMLQPGKPLLVSQATDPAAERKVTVEVTATILK